VANWQTTATFVSNFVGNR